MKFLKQTSHEFRNILRSKFLLIIGILVLVWSIASPIVSLLTTIVPGGGIRPLPGPIMYKEAYSSYGISSDGDQQSITVNGVTIKSDNPFFGEVSWRMQDRATTENNTNQFSKPETLDLVLAMMDNEINYFVKFAQYITTPMDYRMDLAYRGLETLSDKFFYEHGDVAEDVLLEAQGFRKGMDQAAFKKKFITITAEERQAALMKADDDLTTLFSVVENNDFAKYIDISIRQQNDQIASFKDNIAMQEQMIIDNPGQEDNINMQIEETKKQIRMIEENTIPILRYRLEKNIIPNTNVWQNAAISDIENSRSQLIYQTIIKEEQFNSDIGYKQQYGTYKKYVEKMNAQINQLNNTILTAQKSLDAGKPDMKYVPNGSRSRTVQFLDYSVIVALFGVLLGGWLIASEYQQGTIRLLMIRPKTRLKILMSKFAAAFLLCLAVYLAGSLINIIVNGICFGFSDFVYPNYSITGESGFIAYYVPKFLMCIVTIFFAYSVAFMLSVLVKNIAVSIAIPFVCYAGCFLTMSFFAYRSSMEWIAWTPVPFVQLSSFFVQYSPIWNAMQNGISFNMPLGISMLLVLSAACTMIAMLVFRKRDITN